MAELESKRKIKSVLSKNVFSRAIFKIKMQYGFLQDKYKQYHNLKLTTGEMAVKCVMAIPAFVASSVAAACGLAGIAAGILTNNSKAAASCIDFTIDRFKETFESALYCAALPFALIAPALPLVSKTIRERDEGILLDDWERSDEAFKEWLQKKNATDLKGAGSQKKENGVVTAVEEISGTPKPALKPTKDAGNYAQPPAPKMADIVTAAAKPVNMTPDL